MVTDLLIIFFSSLFSSLLAEGISWLLIYRTDHYKKLKADIDRITKKLEKKKEAVGIDSSGTGSSSGAPLTVPKHKGKAKKVDRFEESLKNSNREMTFVRLKSMIPVAATLITLFAFLNTLFDGRTVARLPFEPFPLIRGLSHRGLAGDDWYQCSMGFFYVLCSMGIRSNIQKLFGFTPRSQPSFFAPPSR